MPNRLVHNMRLVGAIIMIALYAFCAAQTPLAASPLHCSSHPCHDVMQSSADDSGGHHIHDGVASADGMAKVDGDDGKAKNHAEPGCQFSCSIGLSPDIAPVMAQKTDVSVAFGAIALDPEDRSPERLIRPPRLSVA
jgi:hypothetical protein